MWSEPEPFEPEEPAPEPEPEARELIVDDLADDLPPLDTGRDFPSSPQTRLGVPSDLPTVARPSDAPKDETSFVPPLPAPQPVAPAANPLRPPEDDVPSPRIRMTDPGPTRQVPPLSSPELTDLVAPKEGGGQRELQLGPRADGGRFENAEPTLIDGEDIDLPAYLRKKRKR